MATKKKTLKERYADAKEYLIREANRVLPFIIEDGRDWRKVNQERMCEDYLDTCNRVVIGNFSEVCSFKEHLLNNYINHWGLKLYKNYMV